MVLTPASSWTSEFRRSGIQPIWYVEIDLRKISGGTITTFYFCTGGVPITTGGNTYDALVETVDEVGQTLDPITREAHVSSAHIVMKHVKDGPLDEILKKFYWPGKRVKIFLATPDVAAAAALQLGVYLVDEVLFEPGRLVLICNDLASMFRDARARVFGVACRHPLHVIRKLLEQLSVSTEAYDVATLDPSIAAHTTISHFVVSRTVSAIPLSSTGGAQVNVLQDITVGEVINQLVMLMYGTWRMNETTGKWEFKLPDRTAAAARHFARSEHGGLALDSVEQKTRVSVSCGRTPAGRSGREYDVRVEFRDANAETFFGYGTEKRVLAESFETEWCWTAGSLKTRIAPTDGAGATFRVTWAQSAAFAGTGWDRTDTNPFQPTTPAQPAWAKLSATRLGYIGLFQSAGTLLHFEVISVKAAASVAGRWSGGREWGADDSILDRQFFHEWDFTIDKRDIMNAYGGDGRDWLPEAVAAGVPYVFAIDLTPVMIRLGPQVRLRYIHGMLRARVRTSLLHADLQIGDFVTLDDDSYYHNSIVGCGANQVWEIVGKSVLVHDDSPGVEWQLALIRDDGPGITLSTSEVAAHYIAAATLVTRDRVVDSTGAGVKDSSGNRVLRG